MRLKGARLGSLLRLVYTEPTGLLCCLPVGWLVVVRVVKIHFFVRVHSSTSSMSPYAFRLSPFFLFLSQASLACPCCEVVRGLPV